MIASKCSWRIPARSLAHRGGFTLVEVLVAAAVFSVVFLTIATLFARATTDFAGTRLLTATMLSQAAMQEALNGDALNSRTSTLNSNGVTWELQQTVDQGPGDLWTIRITVRRQMDGKEYATLWTQVYRPSH